MSDENDLIENNLTNKEIVDFYISQGLINKCMDYQFARLCKVEPWKLQFKQDMMNDLIVVLYEYDNAKLNDAHRNNHMNALITRIIQNNIYSTTSKFYMNYLRLQLQTNTLDDIEGDEDEE